MTNAEYNKLLNAASSKLGSTPEKLRSALEKGEINALAANLTRSDKEKLRAVLSNKELMAKLKKSSAPEDVIRILSEK